MDSSSRCSFGSYQISRWFNSRNKLAHYNSAPMNADLAVVVRSEQMTGAPFVPRSLTRKRLCSSKSELFRGLQQGSSKLGEYQSHINRQQCLLSRRQHCDRHSRLHLSLFRPAETGHVATDRPVLSLLAIAKSKFISLHVFIEFTRHCPQHSMM